MPVSWKKLQVTGIAKLLEQIKTRLSSDKKQYKIFVAGTGGTGKSTLINQLAGEVVAPVGDYQEEPVTETIEYYPLTVQESHLCLIDTPGLGNNEQTDQYLESIRSQIKEFDSVWFVSKLLDSRVSGDEKRAIQLISKTLGPEIWEKSVLVFTFSDCVKPSQHEIALQKRTELLQRVIASYAGADVASHVSSVVVANLDESLPDAIQNDSMQRASEIEDPINAVDSKKLINLLRAASTLMSDPNNTERAAAISKLVELGDEGTVPVLCEALEKDQDAEVRRRAAEALGKMASPGKADTKD